MHLNGLDCLGEWTFSMWVMARLKIAQEWLFKKLDDGEFKTLDDGEKVITYGGYPTGRHYTLVPI